MNDLGKIFKNCGTDKASKHCYHDIYEPLFSPNRDNKINFLEVGIWNGFGMQSFLEYFPKGKIYGLDIFTRMNPSEVPALKDPRAYWAKCDSTLPETSSVLSSQFGVKFDYILDDGAHDPMSNMLTFRHCSPFLKPGGLYIIEDVWPLERMNSDELHHPWLVKNKDKYSLDKNKAFLKELDKSGWEIERFDHRHISGQPDSYVITLRKPKWTQN